MSANSQHYNAPREVTAKQCMPEAHTAWFVRELIARGADPSMRFPDGEDSRTPLMYLAHQGDTPAALEAVTALLQAGARVNARSAEEWTALLVTLATDERAPEWRCGAMVRLLLRHGANVKQVTVVGGNRRAGGQTALQLACSHGAARCDAIPELLAGADAATLMARNPFGNTPLFLVLQKKMVACATAAKLTRDAMLAAGLAEEVAQEEAAVALSALFDKLAKANNKVVALRLPVGKAGALRERYALRVLLAAAGLPESRTAACEADPNPYLTLHTWLEAHTPAVCRTAFTSRPGHLA